MGCWTQVCANYRLLFFSLISNSSFRRFGPHSPKNSQHRLLLDVGEEVPVAPPLLLRRVPHQINR